ncbi:MAG: sodium:solute symporter, partial [Flavobacteriaceae bacterium]|nr:sodium:solute symporter [Flavobacteriaceae bacterium]
VPMQFFILLVGVMVFVFYQFNSAPLHFNPKSKQAIENSSYTSQYQALEAEQQQLFNDKQRIIATYLETNSDKHAHYIALANESDTEIRNEAKVLIEKAAKETNQKIETNDKDYVFIHFILNHLPKGLIGLLLAVILSAAMSSTASELNALASTTTMDIFNRNTKREFNDKQLVGVSKLFTLGWGILAILIACVAHLADNLILLVNIIGSIFYGNVLGIFLLAFFFKFVKGRAVFIGALITQGIVIFGWWKDWMPFLWLNLFGCILVILITIVLQLIFNDNANNA